MNKKTKLESPFKEIVEDIESWNHFSRAVKNQTAVDCFTKAIEIVQRHASKSKSNKRRVK